MSDDAQMTAPWYAPHVQNFTPIDLSEVQASLSTHGHAFTSIALNPSAYLSYLRTQALKLGAEFIEAILPTCSSVSQSVAYALEFHNNNTHTLGQHSKSTSRPTVVVNCTGLGAKPLCGDQGLYPIRGQTLIARISPSPSQEILLWDGPSEVTYVVPRPGTDTFILGGTKDADNCDPEPDPEITQGIIGRCKQLLSTRGKKDVHIDILAEQVGLRPGRKGGVRIEVEKVELADREVIDVVHHYGHAGAGYQNSIGSAKKVLRLVRGICEIK
ncbi:Nn.00g040380.m01.CDS01 [Neocucurbitaria sp. VM-36]